MNKKLFYLQQLEIIPYQLVSLADISANESENWLDLEKAVSTCTRCDLCETRKNTVFGVGNRKARLMLIGEAPGATEDERGEPFVGQAGQLLDKMLAAIGYSRETVFIANILKCRPPNNRDPLPEEIEQCFPYLLKQIEWVKPTLLLALGRVAAQSLLGCKTPLGRLREQAFNFGERNIPLMVTYHPAYLLRNPADKRNAWLDLQRAQAFLSENYR